MPAGLVVPGERVRHQVTDLQEREVVQEVLIGHPVVESVKARACGTLAPVGTPPRPQPPHQRQGGRAAEEVKGRGVGAKRSPPPAALTRTPHPPSSAAAVAGFLGPPCPTRWRWSRDRRWKEKGGSGGILFLPRRFPPRRMPAAGAPELDGGASGERLALGRRPVHLWHRLARGPAVRSAPHLRVPLRGTYLSLQAPFHSTRPQGFRTRSSVSALPS